MSFPLPFPFTSGVIGVAMLTALVPATVLAVALRAERRARADSHARELDFRTLYEHTPAMMHSVDIDRRLLAVNQAWLERLGYTREEVIGRRSTEFLTAQSREHAEAFVIPRFLRDGSVRNQDYQMVAKSGEIFDVRLTAIWECDAQGRPVRTLAVLNDVTEHKRLLAQLAAEQERTAVTLHSIGDGVVATDEFGHVTTLNPVAATLLDLSPTQACGQPFASVVRLHEQASGHAVDCPVQTCLRERRTVNLSDSAVLRTHDGVQRDVQLTVAPILTNEAQLLGVVIVFQDVTQARAHARRLSYLAHHDALTGLPNRVLLHDRVHQACQFGLRHDHRFAVMFMDLDHFKQVNDAHGHAIGDALLKAVAERLGATLRASDTVCRLGGDEFVLLLADVGTPAEAEALAAKVLAELARPIMIDALRIDVGASLGSVLFPTHGEDPDTLMKHADAAMYAAKRAGRNCHRLHAGATAH